jgi:hypothetical protein
MLQIPSLLEDLVAAGRWPRTAQEQLAQILQPLVSPDRVKRLAPDERGIIYLAAPPFRAAGRRADPKDFYNWPSSDPGGIDLDRAIVLGDFGIGSDAPIALDYREDAANPRVLRLRYNEDCPPLIGRWVLLSPDLASFVAALGV